MNDILSPLNHTRRGKPVRIIGIGASAGGLESLDEFLKNVPLNMGLTCVVVQHRSADQKSVLAELLRRSARMRVLDVGADMKVESETIYIAPADQYLSIRNGEFCLERDPARGPMLHPIDAFFRSLANLREQAVGVILSGTGADGAEGVRAIKSRGGLCYAQTPATANYAEMPTRAIESGAIEGSASPDLIPNLILQKMFAPSSLEPGIPMYSRNDEDLLSEVFNLLQRTCGHDFSRYKKGTILRRLERRMQARNLINLKDYIKKLHDDPVEVQELFDDLLIGVTRFFRDIAVWTQLRDEILPKIFEKYPNGATLRAWIVGCSTGEEAYSLAMVFKDIMGRATGGPGYSMQIFASDLDRESLDIARAGLYPETIKDDVPANFLERFFTREKDELRVSKEIREMILFVQHGLAKDPPFTRLDFISCRNVLIYFDRDLQNRAISLLHYSLNPDGFLLLGSSETTGSSPEIFSSLPGFGHFFQKKGGVDMPLEALRNLVGAPSVALAVSPYSQQPRRDNYKTFDFLASQLLLQEYTPAAVLVTETGEILYVSGRTGRYFEAGIGRANWNLFALAREGLGQALNESFFRAQRERVTVTVPDVKVGTGTDVHIADITVRPIDDPDGLKGLILVVIIDKGRFVPAALPEIEEDAESKLDPYIVELVDKLGRSQKALQVTRQEMQISQEELKSTNEELQASNEELQATNEELTTSREEIQSINEELQTVNAELLAKVDELSNASNDMNNLLNSTDIATLFLDDAMQIRRYTERATAIFKLIASDAGRPITDLVSILNYPFLASDVQQVLKTLVFIERQVPANDGRWFNVRIMPYRATNNRIDGVVITFVNISSAKLLEFELRHAQHLFTYAFQYALIGMAILSEDRQWIAVNDALCSLLGFGQAELLPQPADSLVHPDDRQIFQSAVDKTVAAVTVLSPVISIRWIPKTGGPLALQVRIDRLAGEGKADNLYLQFQRD